MVKSRPSSTDEKAVVADESKHKGFFTRRKSAILPDTHEHDEKNHDVKSHAQHDDAFTEDKPAEREIPPVSFTELFRYVVVVQ